MKGVYRQDRTNGQNALYKVKTDAGDEAYALVVANLSDIEDLAGVTKGMRLAAFCDSYKLNGGAQVSGRPAGYAIVDCVCNTDGQVTVSINAPLLAIGSSYQLNCSIVRINAS